MESRSISSTRKYTCRSNDRGEGQSLCTQESYASERNLPVTSRRPKEEGIFTNLRAADSKVIQPEDPSREGTRRLLAQDSAKIRMSVVLCAIVHANVRRQHARSQTEHPTGATLFTTLEFASLRLSEGSTTDVVCFL